jgi:predicted acylesterase/phospholipase RssA
MKEKELRLALVCYGGVSLALYMHGAIKEILKAGVKGISFGPAIEAARTPKL